MAFDSSIAPRRVIEYLKLQGFRVSSPSLNGMCYEVAGLLDNEPFFLYIFNGKFSNSLIIKVLNYKSDCIESLYTPRGLYTIVREETDLQLLPKKIKHIILLSKHYSQ